MNPAQEVTCNGKLARPAWVSPFNLRPADNRDERSRAHSLVEMLAESGAHIREGVDSRLLEREREITNLLNALQVPVFGFQVADLLFERAAIRKNNPRYAALTQPSPLRLREIQEQVLDQDSVLLEYSLGEGAELSLGGQPRELGRLGTAAARPHRNGRAQSAYSRGDDSYRYQYIYRPILRFVEEILRCQAESSILFSIEADFAGG